MSLTIFLPQRTKPFASQQIIVIMLQAYNGGHVIGDAYVPIAELKTVNSKPAPSKSATPSGLLWR